MESPTNDGQDESTLKQLSVWEEKLLTIIEGFSKEQRSTYQTVVNLIASYKFPIGFTILQDVTGATVEIRLKLSKESLDRDRLNRRQ